MRSHTQGPSPDVSVLGQLIRQSQLLGRPYLMFNPRGLPPDPINPQEESARSFSAPCTPGRDGQRAALLTATAISYRVSLDAGWPKAQNRGTNAMSKLVAEAIDALRKLPEERQDELAPLLIALAADETVGNLDRAKPYIAEANIQAGRFNTARRASYPCTRDAR
jgi:hypothetical protein